MSNDNQKKEISEKSKAEVPRTSEDPKKQDSKELTVEEKLKETDE